MTSTDVRGVGARVDQSIHSLEPKQEMEELVSFVRCSLSKGVSFQEIRSHLSEQGKSETRIFKAVNRVLSMKEASSKELPPKLNLQASQASVIAPSAGTVPSFTTSDFDFGPVTEGVELDLAPSAAPRLKASEPKRPPQFPPPLNQALAAASPIKKRPR